MVGRKLETSLNARKNAVYERVHFHFCNQYDIEVTEFYSMKINKTCGTDKKNAYGYIK